MVWLHGTSVSRSSPQVTHCLPTPLPPYRPSPCPRRLSLALARLPGPTWFGSFQQPLVLLIFYGVSGGPFGVEPVVAAGGPLIALLGFIFLPLVWSIPEALVTAELSTTFPEAAGCVAWVRAHGC